jgi:hypothetical protein
VSVRLALVIKAFWMGICLLRVTQAQQYEAIDASTFRIFESLWTSTHESWINKIPSSVACLNSSTVIFPVCHNGFIMDGDYYNEDGDISCADVLCTDAAKGACIFTPTDSMDYVPIFESTADDSSICEPPSDSTLLFPKYGLDEGLPPLFTPVTPYRLDISGRVTSTFGEKCLPVKGVVVEAWQIDLTQLRPYDAMSDSTAKASSLRNISCNGRLRTDTEGLFKFTTSMPPSYGPPRNIAFRVTAPGYHTLYTRVYFDRDGRLQQLTGSADDVPAQIYGQTVSAKDKSHVVWSPDDREAPLNTKANPMLRKDPRIVKLYLESTSSSSAENAIFGRFRADVNFVLTPTSLTAAQDTQPPMDIRGLWSDKNGGLVNVETLGKQFIAAEYPHVRTWGSATGVIQDDAIRGVNFFNPAAPSDWLTVDAEGAKSVTTNPDTSRLIETAPLTVNGEEVWMTRSSQLPSHLRSMGLSTGVILPTDDFASTAYEMSIRWSGGGYSTEWNKVPNADQNGYRYFKLVILRDTGGFPGGKLVINEVELYAGILAERSFPSPKMKTPRTPAPMMISCSSYHDSDSHCYKAVDGDSSSKSYWMTEAVGDRRTTLTTPQWIMIDLGPGHYMRPTAMRITCDAGSKVPFGCPRTFVLIASRDNQEFDVIYSQDMYDYNNSYSGGGHLFTFFWEHSEGRSNGHICGSCDTGPAFTCAVDAFDSTCTSTYCNVNGVCDEPAMCSLGEYFSFSYVENGQRATRCLQCPAGRFGNSTSLRTSACSGLCTQGYYCPLGSSTPTQMECGGVHVICPEGSPAPVLVSMGMYSVALPELTADFDSTVNFATRYLEAPCLPGYYCSNGSAYPCPVGTYGNRTGLATASCSDSCRSGQYCDIGSVVPTICDKGFYCPDGRGHSPCPAGTFGISKGQKWVCNIFPLVITLFVGLKDASCSGPCRPGFYCSQGSTSPRQVPCPPGTFGAAFGHADSACSGACTVGSFCPAGSVSGTSVACGSPSLYCPSGSGAPQIVGYGNYSVGGPVQQRHSQTVCEAGYYCMYGVRYPCPAGSYGVSSGLNYLSSRWSLTPGQEAHYIAAQQTIEQVMKFATGLVQPNSSFWSDTDTELDGFVCSGFCAPGFYCPPNSTSPTQVPCPAGRYGAASGLQNASCSGSCPVGHFCPTATSAPIKCPAGLFGNATGLTSAECASHCSVSGCEPSYCREGYFCPAGSTVADQTECGDNGMLRVHTVICYPFIRSFYRYVLPWRFGRANPCVSGILFCRAQFSHSRGTAALWSRIFLQPWRALTLLPWYVR